MTNLTIKERLDLIPPDRREASFFIPHPREITEKILDMCYIPKTKEYLDYLMYTIQGVQSNRDVIEGYLKDCLKIYEGTYEPFRESLTFNYGFRPLSEEEFIYKGEEFIQDSRWSTQDPAICNYSGLRPIEGYKEEIELEEGVEMFKIGGETDEEKAYRRGYMDGYDEGLYDQTIK